MVVRSFWGGREARKRYDKSVVVNLSIDRVYRLLLDYFSTQPDTKVKRYIEPSFLEVKIEGSLWNSQTRHNVPGKMQIEILPNCVQFTFDFSERWFGWKNLIWLPVALIVFIFFTTLLKGQSLAIYVGCMIGFAFLFLLVEIKNQGETKRRFIERVTDFLKGVEYASQKSVHTEEA